MIVTYKKKFPTGQFLNEDIGFEKEVNGGQDPLEVLAELKALAERFHKDNNPGLYLTNTQTGEVSIGEPMYGIPDSKEERIQIMIKDLNKSASLKELQSWSLLTRTSPLIEEAYNKKHSELQNKGE